MSTTLSPSIVITENPGSDFSDVIKLSFGHYVQAYDVKNYKH